MQLTPSLSQSSRFCHLPLARSRLLSRRVLLVGAPLVVLLAGGALTWLGLRGGLLPTAPTPTPVATSQTAMFGVDAQHTRAMTTEHLLTPRTVAHLVEGWTSLPTGGALFSSPVVADGQVYIGSLDGRLYVYSGMGCAQASCAPLWTSIQTGARIFSSPAVANRQVYIGSNDGRLYAFKAAGCGRASCPQLWASPDLHSRVSASPTIEGDIVYIGTDANIL